ncbi:MAG: glycine cleavage system protein GcvH [Acidimicrobiia bacterium]
MTPGDRRYTNQHQWVKPAEDDLLLVGITDFAQEQLGDIEFVELPEVGEELEEGEPYGVVESAKTASDLFTPVDGEVVEVNPATEDDPSVINTDPYGAGWLLKIRPNEEDVMDRLMPGSEYAEMVGD